MVGLFLKILISVLLFLIAVVLFVLFSRFSVRVKYKEKFYLYLGLSFIKIKVLPSNKNKKKTKKKTKVVDNKGKTNKAKKAQKQKKHLLSKDNVKKMKQSNEAKEKAGLSETLQLVSEILSKLAHTVGKSGKIKINALKVVVSKPDAKDTAVSFGICCGIVSSILAMCSLFGKSHIEDENVGTTPDFVSGKSSIETDVEVSFRVISVLIDILKPVIKRKI